VEEEQITLQTHQQQGWVVQGVAEEVCLAIQDQEAVERVFLVKA
jgi:hypothetical protein